MITKPVTSAREIIAHVCDFHGVTLADLRGKSRVRHIAQARMHVFHALRDYGLSTTAIGDMINRHHTTVIIQSRRWPVVFSEGAR